MLAKRGGFHGPGDTLLRATDASNLTIVGHGAALRMRRADYGNASRYAHSEFRMGMSFYSVRNLTIEGLTVEETGGDSPGRYSHSDRLIPPVYFISDYPYTIYRVASESL